MVGVVGAHRWCVHVAVLCIWHVCMCVCVCMLTYMYAHMLSASLGKGSVWLRGSRGEHWIGWHGTLNPRQASERSVSGMLCLVDGDVKVFLGIDYSFEPTTLSPLSRRQKVCAVPITIVIICCLDPLGR